MPTQNIECQLAQGQLNRYLAGDPISDTALVQLEGHVSECETCRLMLAEKRKALESMVSKPASTVDSNKAAQPAPETPLEASSPVPKFLVDAIRKGVPNRSKTNAPQVNLNHAVIEDMREPLPTRSAFLKPMLYSVGLAGVLIVMSTIMRDPTRYLGEKLADTKTAEVNKPTAEPTSTSKQLPATTAAASVDSNRSEPTVTKSPEQPPKTSQNEPKSGETEVEGSAQPVKSEIVTEEKTPRKTEELPQPPAKTEPTTRVTASSTKSPAKTTSNARRNTSGTKRTAKAPRRSNASAKTQPKSTNSQRKLRVYDENGNVVAAP